MPSFDRLEPLDLEPLGPQVFEWLAQEMVGLDASRKRVEQAYADDAVDRA